MKVALKKKFRMSKKVKRRVKELNDLFFKDDHAYLKGELLEKKYKNEIEELYHKYIYPIYNIGWGTDVYKIEMSDLRKDRVCGGNSNKKHWVMSYILGWVADMKTIATAEDLFSILSSREANLIVAYSVYETRH